MSRTAHGQTAIDIDAMLEHASTSEPIFNNIQTSSPVDVKGVPTMSDNFDGYTSIDSSSITGTSSITQPANTTIGIGQKITDVISACGKKIEANYQHAVQSFADYEQQRRAEAMKQREHIYDEVMVELAASVQQRTAQFGESPQINRSDLGKLITDIQDSANQAEYNRKLAESLRKELGEKIAVGTGVLPSDTIQQVNNAIQTGDVNQLRGAIVKLDLAWKQVRYDYAQQQQWKRATTTTIQQSNKKIAVMQSIITAYPEFQSQLEQIIRENKEIAINQDTYPESAAQRAITLQEKLNNLERDITNRAFNEQQNIQERRSQLLGGLSVLRHIITDECNPAVHRDTINGLLNDILRIEQHLHNASTSDLSQLTTEVEILKKRIFAFIHEQQQQFIAATTQEALNDIDMTQITQDVVGESMRIKAKHVTPGSTNLAAPGVEIYISRDGEINFDFQNYIGSACTKDAQRLVNALRRRGVFVIDPTTLTNIPQPAGMTNAEYTQIITDPQHQPTIRVTKPQARAHVVALQALHKMGLHIIQEHQYIDVLTGETITEIDASRDGLGFTYAVKSHENGDREITNNGQYTSNTDPILTAIHNEEQQRTYEEQREDEQHLGYTPDRNKQGQK